MENENEVMTTNDEVVEICNGEIVDLKDEGFTLKDGLLLSAAGAVIALAVKGAVDTFKWGKEKIQDFKENRKTKKSGKKKSKKEQNETEDGEFDDFDEFEPDEESEEIVENEQ